MPVRRHPWWSPVVAVLLVLLCGAVPGAARAAVQPRPADFASLTQTAGGTRVLVHYKASYAAGEGGLTSAVSIDQAYAQVAAQAFDEAYSRLVGGAGGTPNAGLRAPVSDGTLGGDGRIDVYVVPMSFATGAAARDDQSAEHSSGYVQLNPSVPATGALRFRAAHELMHVIQFAYAGNRGGMFSESQADWAAEWAMPDVDPLDSRFASPWLPIECVSTWDGESCGSAYGSWQFVQLLTERWGGDVIDDWLTRIDAAASYTSADERTVLDTLIAAQSGGTSSLSAAYRDYAERIWDPTAWTTTAIASLYAYVSPAFTDATVSRGATTVSGGVAVDHLGARYVRARDLGVEPAGPDDRFRITGTGGAVPAVLVGNRPGGGRTRVPCSGASAAWTCDVPADPATVMSAVLPLINESTASPAGDGRAFTWSVQLVPGTPAPPAYDTKAGAQTIGTGAAAALDTAYAGGRGEDEAPCGPGYTKDARRGVWLRWTAPYYDRYIFDFTGADFFAVEAMYLHDTGKLVSCVADWAKGEHGPRISTLHWNAGTTVDIYIGRHTESTADGHTARLTITPSGDYPAPAPSGGAPAGGGTTEPKPDVTGVRMALVSSRLRASRAGVVTLRLRCPKGEVLCFGTVSAVPSVRTMRMARKSFNVVGGHTSLVRWKLSRASLRALRRAKTVKVRLTIVAYDSAYNRTVVRKTVVVRAPATR